MSKILLDVFEALLDGMWDFLIPLKGFLSSLRPFRTCVIHFMTCLRYLTYLRLFMVYLRFSLYLGSFLACLKLLLTCFKSFWNLRLFIAAWNQSWWLWDPFYPIGQPSCIWNDLLAWNSFWNGWNSNIFDLMTCLSHFLTYLGPFLIETC